MASAGGSAKKSKSHDLFHASRSLKWPHVSLFKVSRSTLNTCAVCGALLTCVPSFPPFDFHFLKLDKPLDRVVRLELLDRHSH